MCSSDLVADSATAKVLSVSDVGAAGAAAAVGLPGAVNDPNKAFDLTTALTTTADEAKLTGNASVLFEVMDVNESAKTVKLKATASVLDVNGNNKTTNATDDEVREVARIAGCGLAASSKGWSFMEFLLTSAIRRL